jgi:CubicO group peptidase (beta-lactamase class C family)
MRSLPELAEPWERRLHELVEHLDVPGAVLGVSHRGERIVIATGVAGLRNPQPVTADTVFQLGSISKVYTATLLMAVAGPEILERPVAELVPETAGWLEPEILVGHLLTHSSGLGGDHFADTGRGDDALERYVATLADLERDVPAPPGVNYSYCNSGFAVLGRLVELLTGETYDEALRTRVLAPLGATATSTLPEQTILQPVALGHNRADGGALRADDAWNFARSCGPLGGVCASAPDLLTFAELHLHDGRTADGAQLLDAGVARLMRSRRLATPPLARPSARGLGWGIYDWPDGELVGHDGETLGQIATLRLLGEHELALVVLTNAIPDGDEVTRALTEAVLEAWDLTPPTLPVPANDAPFDPRPYAGRYRNLMATTEVAGAPGGLRLTTHYTTEGLAEETQTTQLRAIGDGAFVDVDAARPTRAVRFEDPGPDGRLRSYFNGRVARRVAPSG